VAVTEPIAGALLYGMSDLAAVVTCPEGEAPASLTFLVDARSPPPWRARRGARRGRGRHVRRAAGRVAARRSIRALATDRVLTPAPR